MKKLIMVVIALLYSFIGANMVFAAGDTWTQKADFGGGAREFSVGFSIGSKGYIAVGCDRTTAKQDLWEYDPVTNIWTQKADFGGGGRLYTVGFSIGSKGYIGTGNNNVTKDFWEYNPATNKWTRKTDFGGLPRFGAVGFSIGSKGYLGMGATYNGSTWSLASKDFWEYDQATDRWVQKADFAGPASSSIGFSIGNKGYIGIGTGTAEFWEYDPATNIWTRKANFGGTARMRPVRFSIGNKGYVGLGFNNETDFWEYDQDTDTWTRKADFSGIGRDGAVGLSIGNKGYIGTGCGNGSNIYYKDFWEYAPSDMTPDQFIFNYETGAALNTVVDSNTITVSGINSAATISITGGKYSINGGAYTSADGKVNNGDTVTVQQTSSASYLTTTVATLTIGGMSDTFSVTTMAADTTPDQFTFGGQTNVVIGIVVTSNTITVSGLSAPAPISISGGTYSINGGPYTSASGTVNNSDTVTVQLTSSGSYSTMTSAILTIGDVSGIFSATTQAENSGGPNTWTQKADLTKVRDLAASFSIGSKGYIGTGYASSESKDFWEYDPVTNVWTQKADFGGLARYGAVGFSIDSKGYIVLGRVGGGPSFTDFWEYNPADNTWTQKADFGAAGRIDAVGFSIGNKGYVGTGFLENHSIVKDFWEYDPATDKWTQKADFGGGTRSEAVGFSIGSKGYIGTGGKISGGWIYYKDFWEYDPDTDRWTRKADFGGVARNTAVGFSIGNKGYIGTGGDFGINGTIANGARGPYHYKDFWEYDSDTDTWTQRTDFGGAARREAVAFSIGNRGYIGAGMKSSGTYGESMCKDFWEYTPGDSTSDTTPDQFIFNYETGADLNTVVTSNTITVSGIDAPIPISITGGKYSINGGAYTSAKGTVNNGDKVTVQQTSSGSYSTKTDAILTIGGVSDTFSVTTIHDTVPDNFSFNVQTGVTFNTVTTSNTLTVSGIDAATPISITGGKYSINGGSYTSANDTVNNGDTVTVQLTSSGSYSTETDAILTIGGVSKTYSVTTIHDTVPDNFSFTSQTGVALNAVVTSNTITATGIDAATPITITGSTYSINGGSYTSADGMVNNGDTVTLRQTSSGSYSTTTNAILVIGGISGTFSVTTIHDTVPDNFSFNSQTGVTLNSVATSNTLTVSGIDAPTPISITGGAYSINDGSYTSVSGIVNNGDKVTVQLTSSESYSTETDAILTIGGISGTFSVTTIHDTTPDSFSLTSQAGVALNTVIISNTITVSGIDAATPISIKGGTYSVNGGSYTSVSGTVNNGDKVTVQQTSSGSYSTTTNANLVIGGLSSTFSVTTIHDTVPDNFSFIGQTGVALNAVATSSIITVSGIDAATPISIKGGTYSVNGGSYNSADGIVNNGDKVTVRQTSSGSYSTETVAILTIGGVTGTFSVTTIHDTVPDGFSFIGQTGVALNTVATSNTLTVSGIDAATPISITGGKYSINGGSYTSVSGTVNNGDKVTVQQTSSGSYSTTTNAILVIGGLSGTFSVTTTHDTVPDNFSFIGQTGVALNTVITSNTITVSGIDAATPISITGGTYSINGGPYTSVSGTVNNGDKVTVHLTSSGKYFTTNTATLTIGGVSGTFSVTTKAGSIITLNPVASKTTLWPPDNKMVDVTIKANAGDSSGGSVTLTAKVSCNESAKVGTDWTTPVINQKTGVISLSLRATRLGSGTGRIYTITITATGTQGNSTTKNIYIYVLHDQSDKKVGK